MENDSDALTSDKLRHKACAVPTKLDINNTQVYFITDTTNGRRYPRISSDSYSKHVSLENAYLKIGCR
jgi:hypothetical protein